jgi:hypothetical protein
MHVSVPYSEEDSKGREQVIVQHPPPNSAESSITHSPSILAGNADSKLRVHGQVGRDLIE